VVRGKRVQTLGNLQKLQRLTGFGGSFPVLLDLPGFEILVALPGHVHEFPHDHPSLSRQIPSFTYHDVAYYKAVLKA